jgi:hypothetical protein
MKKFLVGFLTMVLLAVFTLPAFAANYDYVATVYKRTGNTGVNDLTEITTAVQFKVLTVDTDTAATITKFGSNAGTAVTNPVTAANFAAATVCGGKVKFRTTAASVDLIVVHNTGGYTTVIRGFTPNMHTIIIDEEIGVVHHGLVWYLFNSGGAATDTGIVFTPKTAILDVFVEQVVIDNSETLNVGTSDTAAGFRTGVALSTGAEGFTQDTGVITAGSTLDYYAASNYGTLLTTAITGGNALDTGGGNSRKPHFVVTAGTDDDLYYTPSTSDTAAGYIHYTFIRLR